MGVTIRDVAEHAGVSISTVSRVLNKTCPVNVDKQRRVEDAVRVLGYIPNPAARSLLKRETGGLGVLLPFVGGEFFSEFLNGIDQATQENEYFLLISSSHRSTDEFLAALRGMNKRVDGLLIMATEMRIDRLQKHLPRDLPLVFVNSETESGGQEVINFDNFGGIYQATEHVIELGHRRIAMIKGPEEANDAKERLRGFRAALEAHGLPLDPALEIDGEFSREAGYDAAQQFLALEPRPTAIVAANDYGAIGALRALQEVDVRVPHDVSIVGFDDVPSAHYTTPPLTTIRVPVKEMGVLAIEHLIRRIRGEAAAPLQLRLPVELVCRASTAPPAATAA